MSSQGPSSSTSSIHNIQLSSGGAPDSPPPAGEAVEEGRERAGAVHPAARYKEGRDGAMPPTTRAAAHRLLLPRATWCHAATGRKYFPAGTGTDSCQLPARASRCFTRLEPIGEPPFLHEEEEVLACRMNGATSERALKPSARVRLNVGGRRFETTVATLTG